MASLPQHQMPDTRFSIKGRIVIDTGSGVHIVGKNNIDPQAAHAIYTGRPYRLNTANGSIDVSNSINIVTPGFQGVLQACVLDNSPNVLSVGRLCDDGWTFH